MSAQFVDGPIASYKAAGAIPQYSLVKISAAGTVDVAGLADEWDGSAELPAFAADEVIPIRLRNAQGTRLLIAAGAITLGAKVYGRASGKVDDNSGSSAILVGKAMQAAGADTELVEVQSLP